MRKLFYWKLKDREIQLGERTILLGVLNVTPDSFSDGGKYADPDRAFARALEMEEQGADVIDVGAESTRPGSARISAAEELRRLIPVLKRLRGHLGVPVSVDTYKAEVAERALEHGAEIINDPSGLTFEPQLARVVSNHDAGLILNHMRGRPESWAKLPPVPDVMGMIVRDLEATVSRAGAPASTVRSSLSTRASASASARSRTRRSWRGWANWRGWSCRCWSVPRASLSWPTPRRPKRLRHGGRGHRRRARRGPHGARSRRARDARRGRRGRRNPSQLPRITDSQV